MAPAAGHGPVSTAFPSARPSIVRDVSDESTSIPVTIAPAASPVEEEIRRLTRIILSDIVIYSPDRADKAILEGRFPEIYRAEIEEGRKMIRSRFQGTGAAVETYERALRELLDTRRRDLQKAAENL